MPRSRRRAAAVSAAAPCIAALLAWAGPARAQPRYGFDLVRPRAQADGLVTSEGTIYPLLSRLRRDGLVTTTWHESPSGPPRRYYELTAQGRRALALFTPEWDRFTDHGSPFPDRFARKIDTRLAPPLRTLANEGNDPALTQVVRDILKRLAVRNLLRGYLLAIPTGQAVAGGVGVPALTAAELQQLEPGTYFFIEHPATDTAESRATGHVGYTDVAVQRAAVVRAWTDPEVRRVIEKRGIELLGPEQARAALKEDQRPKQ